MLSRTFRYRRSFGLAFTVASVAASCGGIAVIDGDPNAASSSSAGGASSTGGGFTAATTGGGGTGGCVDRVLATDQDGAIGPAIAADGIYWGSGKRVWRHRPDSGLPDVAGPIIGTVGDIAVETYTDGTPTAVLATADGALYLVDVDGQVATTIASGPSRVLIADRDLFWIINSGSATDGEVVRLSMGMQASLIDDLGYPRSIANDDNQVFALAEIINVDGDQFHDALVEIAMDGSTKTLVTSGLHKAIDLAVTQNNIFLLEQDSANGAQPGAVRMLSRTLAGPLQPIATIDDGRATRIAADDRTVVYTVVSDEQGTSTTHRVDLNTLADEVIATWPATSLVDVAMSDDYIVATAYWEDQAPPAGTPSVRLFCRR